MITRRVQLRSPQKLYTRLSSQPDFGVAYNGWISSTRNYFAMHPGWVVIKFEKQGEYVIHHTEQQKNYAIVKWFS